MNINIIKTIFDNKDFLHNFGKNNKKWHFYSKAIKYILKVI